jgi:mannitol/fructose-specific phosphotransferase system IIA component (Ntr-type)
MSFELSHVEPQASIADYTRPELIIPRLCGADPAGIVEELSHKLHAFEIIGDKLSFYHAVLNHDMLTNSALPTGIAIPHARGAQVRRLALAVGRTSRPVVWGIKGSWLVDHVFLIAVPATDALEYLALLSSIANFGRQTGLLAKLRSAADAGSIFELLKQIQARPGLDGISTGRLPAK